MNKQLTIKAVMSLEKTAGKSAPNATRAAPNTMQYKIWKRSNEWWIIIYKKIVRLKLALDNLRMFLNDQKGDWYTVYLHASYE